MNESKTSSHEESDYWESATDWQRLPAEIWLLIFELGSAQTWLRWRVCHRSFYTLYPERKNWERLAAAYREKSAFPPEICGFDETDELPKGYLWSQQKGYQKWFKCRACGVIVGNKKRNKHLWKHGRTSLITCPACHGNPNTEGHKGEWSNDRMSRCNNLRCPLDLRQCCYGEDFWKQSYYQISSIKKNLSSKQIVALATEMQKHQDNICSFQSYQFVVKRHEELCGQLLRDCYFCGEAIPKKDFTEHSLNLCPDRLVTCKWFLCSVQAKYLEPHEKICGSQLRRCRYNCGHSYEQRYLAGHEYQCSRKRMQNSENLIWDAQGNLRKIKEEKESQNSIYCRQQ